MKIQTMYTLLIALSLLSCSKDDTSIPTTFELIVEDTSIPEGDTSGMAIVIAIGEGHRPEDVHVKYSTSEKTAKAGIDYVAQTGTLIYASGGATSEMEIIIEIIGDDEIGEEKYFSVNFTYVLAGQTKSESIDVTIYEDDAHPTYPGYSTPLEYPGMDLLWQDEFDDKFDTDNWTYAIGNGCPNLCGWGNSELQYYRAENTVVAKGLLTITAKEEDYDGSRYTSSRILSQDKFEFAYGRVDIRARLPEGKGIWPALWMLGANRNEVGWPAAGEIDIMELRGSIPWKTCATLHYQNEDGNHDNTGAQCYLLFGGEKFSDEFHVYTFIWDEDHIAFYLDDQKFNEILFTDLNLESKPNPFLKQFYFLFNMAVGGHYDGNPDDSTIFPQIMDVDYVRVFQDN